MPVLSLIGDKGQDDRGIAFIVQRHDLADRSQFRLPVWRWPAGMQTLKLLMRDGDEPDASDFGRVRIEPHRSPLKKRLGCDLPVERSFCHRLFPRPLTAESRPRRPPDLA